MAAVYNGSSYAAMEYSSLSKMTALIVKMVAPDENMANDHLIIELGRTKSTDRSILVLLSGAKLAYNGGEIPTPARGLMQCGTLTAI
jgi:hypothetical protein